MDPAATAVWPAGGRVYEAYEDYARSYLPVSAHPTGHPPSANLAWQPPQPGLDTERQHEDTVRGRDSRLGECSVREYTALTSL